MWSILLIIFFGVVCLAQSEGPAFFTELNATTFSQMLNDTTTPWFDVIVDVRSQDEFNEGHIPGATLVADLAAFGTASQGDGTPLALAGCEYCHIVVYCRTGARAAVALEVLRNASFVGYLYNGLGVSQWQEEGYSLVTDESVVPPCTTDNNVTEQCRLTYLAYTSGSVADTVAPSTVPSSNSTLSPAQPSSNSTLSPAQPSRPSPTMPTAPTNTTPSASTTSATERAFPCNALILTTVCLSYWFVLSWSV